MLVNGDDDDVYVMLMVVVMVMVVVDGIRLVIQTHLGLARSLQQSPFSELLDPTLGGNSTTRNHHQNILPKLVSPPPLCPRPASTRAHALPYPIRPLHFLSLARGGFLPMTTSIILFQCMGLELGSMHK